MPSRSATPRHIRDSFTRDDFDDVLAFVADGGYALGKLRAITVGCQA